MHHAHSDGGAGWCMFSDLTLALHKLRKETQREINKVMIIDTDVHQVGQQVLLLTHAHTKMQWLDDYSACIMTQ